MTQRFRCEEEVEGEEGALRIATDVRDNTGDKTPTTWLPRHLVKLCLTFFHEGLGHPGASRMIKTVRKKYYWSKMDDDITNYCNSCRQCKLRRADYKVPRLPLSRYPGVTKAFQRVHIDLVGPLTKTDSGYEYILVIKDALTQ